MNLWNKRLQIFDLYEIRLVDLKHVEYPHTWYTRIVNIEYVSWLDAWLFWLDTWPSDLTKSNID